MFEIQDLCKAISLQKKQQSFESACGGVFKSDSFSGSGKRVFVCASHAQPHRMVENNKKGRLLISEHGIRKGFFLVFNNLSVGKF